MNPSDFSTSRHRPIGSLNAAAAPSCAHPFSLTSAGSKQNAPATNKAPTLVAESATDFGFSRDEIRLALAHASVMETQKISGLATAVAVAAKAGSKKLSTKPSSPSLGAGPSSSPRSTRCSPTPPPKRPSKRPRRSAESLSLRVSPSSVDRIAPRHFTGVRCNPNGASPTSKAISASAW